MSKPSKICVDDELSILWQHLYECVVNTVKSQQKEGCEIHLPGCCVQSISVEPDGILMIKDQNGLSDYAENFEDSVLYEVYEAISQTI